MGTGSGILAARLMGKKVGVCGMDAGTWQVMISIRKHIWHLAGDFRLKKT